MKTIIYYLIQKWRKRSCPHVSNKSQLQSNVIIYNRNNLIMEEDTRIAQNARIMNLRAKFVIKKGSGAAFGLTVITGNHMSIVGVHKNSITNELKDKYDVDNKYDQDVIVDEEVWIASNVTLLAGTHIPRGCIIGSGSVVRSGKIPPYSILAGNPAKLIGFRFTPSEIIEHEKHLYCPEERIELEKLEDNYNKYFVKRIKLIKDYITI